MLARGKVTKEDVIEIRRLIVELCYRLGESGAHLGGCLSLAEIMAVLYGRVIKMEAGDFRDSKRDRLIMSKGHGSIAMYAGMYKAGLISNLGEFGNLLGEGNVYYKQEVRNPEKGLEFSSGSLGQGLAYAIGIAWCLKKAGNFDSKVYVILGEGECNEGSIWEAASIASHMRLNNIIAIIDMNGLQIDGKSNLINNQAMMPERWRSFGFDVDEINGHSIKDIEVALSTSNSQRPRAIIAKTIKGKGVSFAENQVEWHQNVLSEVLYRKALEELSI